MKGKNFKILVILLLFLFCSFQFLFAQTIPEVWIETEPKLELGLPLGHFDDINSVTYSPDGRFIASGSEDETIKIWDVLTGRCLKTLQGHQNDVKTVEYSPDGRFIASGGYDNTIKIWEVETGRCLRTLKGPVGSVAYSPDGKFLVSRSGKLIKIWDVETGKCLKTLRNNTERVLAAAFSPDGKFITSVIQNDGIGNYKAKVRIWDVLTGKCINTFILHNNTTVHLPSIAYSPDGKFIASERMDNTIKICDIASNSCINTLKGHKSRVLSITYAPNGKFISSYSVDVTLYSKDETEYSLATTIKIWDIETGICLKTFQLKDDRARSIRFSPDSEYIAVGTGNGNIAMWNTKSGTRLNTFQKLNERIKSIAYSSDGNCIASGGGDNLNIWNIKDGTFRSILHGYYKIANPNSICFSPDNEYIASPWGYLIKIWQLRGNSHPKTLELPTSWVTSITYSPNGKLLASALASTNKYQSIKVWDIESGNCIITLSEVSYIINTIAFSLSSKCIASGGWDDLIKIWDIASGTLLKSLEGHQNGVLSVTYAPDGKVIASGSADDTIKIWEAETGTCLRTLKGHKQSVASVVFSPDGSFIASGSWDNTVKIWNTNTGNCLKTLKGHTSWVNSVAYSPDGRYIISGSSDTSVKIWDVSSGKCLATLHSFGDDDWSVTTQEGLFDASAGAMKKMYFVQGLEMIELEQLKDRYYEPGLLAKIMGHHEEGITIDPEELPERVKLYPEIDALVMADTLRVKLIPREGGIGKVRVAINGKEIADDILGDRGAGNSARTEGSGAVYLTVPLKNDPNLVPGEENEISVYAYEEGNWLKSRPVVCTYRTEPVDTTLIPKVHIIASGISDYTGSNIDLNFAAKDAEDIAYALSLGAKKLFGTDKTEVHLLTAGKDESKYGFRNREPTKENIRGAIEEVAEKAKSTDIVIIYLSGHGISYGSDPGDFYYLTKEAKSSRASTYSDPVIRRNASISSTELMELVKQVPANRQVLIIDTCASGQVVDNLLANRDISSSTVRALDRMKDRTGMFILTGSAADAVSYEASSFGQGVLTYSILEGIKGAALRDNTYIDVMTLFTRAQERVPQLAEHLGGIQRPEVFAQNRLGSFDIGMVTPEEQEKVPLARPRPVFIQSNFQDEYVPRDIIDLEKYVDEELKRRAEQGRYSDCVFVPVREYPHAYSLGGRYEQKEEGITLKAGLFEGDNPVETFTITAKDAKTLAYQLVEQALRTANEK